MTSPKVGHLGEIEMDSTTRRKIYGLEDARLKWGIVLLNAMSHKRMDEAERMIAIIDKKLERLRNN